MVTERTKCISFGVLHLATVATLVTLLALHFQLKGKSEEADNRTVLDLNRLDQTNSKFLAELQRHKKTSNKSNLITHRDEHQLTQNSYFRITSLVRAALARAYTSNGWTVVENYAFKYYNDSAINYSNATQRCTEIGGRLATEILRHRDTARHFHDVGIKGWVGFDDIQKEGKWDWIDGGRMNPETTAWNTDEPNDVRGNEDCGEIFATSETKVILNDVDCAQELPYVCEVKVF